MKNQVKYRESEYFNDKDYFIIDSTLGKLYVSQVQWYNGAWYSIEGLKLKMTSIKSINYSELYNQNVRYINTEVTGKIVKYMNPISLGIIWNGGSSIRKYGLPNFWNNPINLEVC